VVLHAKRGEDGGVLEGRTFGRVRPILGSEEREMEGKKKGGRGLVVVAREHESAARWCGFKKKGLGCQKKKRNQGLKGKTVPSEKLQPIDSASGYGKRKKKKKGGEKGLNPSARRNELRPTRSQFLTQGREKKNIQHCAMHRGGGGKKEGKSGFVGRGKKTGPPVLELLESREKHVPMSTGGF